jgi:putative mRNA 3-end processing factor
MVKITFLGACYEIGRSGILVESDETDDSVLLDYGVRISGEEKFPMHIRGRDLTAIVLTHAHLDHSGALPLFYISGDVPVYMTRLTHANCEVLLTDMVKISNTYLPFTQDEVNRMTEFTRFLSFNERRKVGKNAYVTLFNSGHIPGGAMVLLEMDGKNILYTGDFNTSRTQLLEPAVPVPQTLDCIITEGTYGNSEHEPRRTVEDRFLAAVAETVGKGGRVLVPAFGVSRSQELLMVLTSRGSQPVPIYVDGMARKVAYIYTQYPDALGDYQAYMDAYEQAFLISNHRYRHEREMAVQSPAIYLAPSGMLRGGTARFYVQRVVDDPDSAIFLVSYQAADTPGRVLMEENMLAESEDLTVRVPVQARVEFFDFSSHSGKEEMIEFFEDSQFRGPERPIFIVHSDAEVLKAFAAALNERGFQACGPTLGESFHI